MDPFLTLLEKQYPQLVPSVMYYPEDKMTATLKLDNRDTRRLADQWGLSVTIFQHLVIYEDKILNQFIRCDSNSKTVSVCEADQSDKSQAKIYAWDPMFEQESCRLLDHILDVIERKKALRSII